jgi:hypothetical protein
MISEMRDYMDCEGTRKPISQLPFALPEKQNEPIEDEYVTLAKSNRR